MAGIMAAILNSPGRILSCIGLTRSFSSTSVSFTGKGIRGAVKGLRLREEELQELDADDLDNITESSLETFNREAENVLGDAKRYQDHLRHKTIEQKYFKPRGPVEVNLLTWSMKEQLKYLHSSDPNQWTPEILAESFPISPEGVVRLLQSHWSPKSEAERQRHDRAVATRWKKHMKGQLGSFKILEKTLNDKFIPENLPAPVLGMNQILNMLDGLEFDGEKPYDAKALKFKNRLPKQQKMKGQSFSSIIEEYKKQTEVKNQSEEKSTSITNLTAESGAPRYEGSYSKVTGGGSTVRGRKMNRHSHRKSELMTFTDFKTRKKV